ncbi:GH25 family lysozyme [Clostridium felsineum]|uniref:Autolytic lysozyme n=1 Tax=Clostridium felsineum TaxID=36839 RepID=A0A1S8KZQ3_9CLOT|nr:GH25 family lysozyme [Clostridium felsineum]URZ06499.1 Autolytic lysozyme [Clostridium felsineum]URZ11534.1 Autolytic lysozyme [Clostridium felsineum]
MKNKIISLVVAFTCVSATFFMPKNVHAQTYKGIDIYEYDNIQDWNTVKNSGVSVVIQKATEGLYHNDSLLNYRYPKITSIGLKIGYYHFANNSGDPVGEAQHFLSRIQGLHSDTCLWLDIENQPNWKKQQAIAYTNQFISYVQSQGYKIGVYTGLSFYYEYLQGNIPSNIPLWLASYGRQPLQYPSLVSWQYSESGNLPGVVGNVDTDYFNDSIFTGQAPNSTSTATTKTNIDTSISSLQNELNRQGYGNLKVDNIAGRRTLSTCPTVHKGSRGNITKWIQQRLGVTADGINGYQTQVAIKNFQRAQGLYLDGIVGKNTWRALLGL